MAINPQIKALANLVRNAVYGKEVRKSIADSMELTSETTEETKNRQNSLEGQFQTVIEETTGKDVISAPEIIAARGTYPNLSQRLLTQEKKLDETPKGDDQKDFYSFHDRNSSNSYPNKFSVLGDRHIAFEVGLSDTDSVIHTFKKNSNDDFIKWITSQLNYLPGAEGTDRTIHENYDPLKVTGGTLSGSRNNFYAITVGTTITFEFTGKEIYFSHTISDNGGIWEITIDGGSPKTFSTHVNNVPTEDLYISLATRLIAKDLADTPHTLKMVFKGDDPLHAPSGGVGTSRGWIRVDDGSSGDPNSNRSSFSYVKSASVATIESVELLSNSNKEFAFNVKPALSSELEQWFPEHNATGTLFVGNTGKQNVYLDGKKVSHSEVVSDKVFKEAKVIQKLEGIFPPSNKLATFLITATINHKGVALSSKVVWEKDTFIKAGYVNMVTVNPSFGKKMISSLGGRYSLKPIDNSLEAIPEETPTGFIFLNDTDAKGFYMYMQSFSIKDTLRIGEEGRKGEPKGTELYFLQHRNSTLQKLYPHVYDQHTVKAGETFFFEGQYGFGKHPEVGELF